MPGRPLFDSILVFENYPIDQALRRTGEAAPAWGAWSTSRSRTMRWRSPCSPEQTLLNLEFSYDRARFDEAGVQRLRDGLHGLLEQIAANAERPLGALGLPDMMKQGECWTGAASESCGIAVGFLWRHRRPYRERGPRSRPRRLRWCGATSVSYGELNARANRLARRLRRWGIGPDRLVGLALARSSDMMVALLAVLKAGGAYLPLDPDYPAERLAHMLRDSATRLVLTQGALLQRFAPVLRETGVEALRLDEPQQWRVGDDASNLDVEIHPDSLAYVIYTSGSTGTPKGVAVAHGPLAMHCEAIGRLYGMNAGDREFQSASINFDIAHETVAGAVDDRRIARPAVQAGLADRRPRQRNREKFGHDALSASGLCRPVE